MTDLVDEVDHQSPTFKRRIALGVAAVALVGSLVGLLHSWRSNLENEAARDAAQFALDRVATATEVDADVFGDAEVVGLVARLRALRVLADARELTALPESDEGADAAAASDRFERLATALAGHAPAQTLPQLLFAQQDEFGPAFTAEFNLELADAAADDNGAIADACVAVLAVLAVALFLLGLSVTTAGVGRFVLAVPGALVAVVATGWAVHLALQDTSTVDRRLVERTAEARTLVAAGDEARAIDLLDDVLDDDPGYGRALATRALARTLEASGEPEDPFANFHYADDDDLDEALADAQAARDHGLADDLGNLATLGFLYFNDGDGEAAVRVYRQLVERNENDGFALYALGASLLLTGDDDAARDAYEDGADVLRDLIDAGQLRLAATLIAAAYSDGERVLAARPSADDVVHDVRASLVALSARLAGDEELPGSAPGGSLDGDPSVVVVGPLFSVVGVVDGASPDTRVTSVWLHRRPGRTDIPSSVPTGSVNFPMLVTTLLGDADNFEHRVVHPLGSLGRCPVPGSYRVDVYLDRDFAGSATIEVPEPGIGALVFSENEVTDVGVCRPEDWTAEQGDNEVVFTDPDSSDRIELRAFASTAEQREAPDRNEVMASMLEASLDADGFTPQAPPEVGFPLLGVTDDGRLVCIGASAVAGIDTNGRGRIEVMAFGPDGVFRALAFESDETERVIEIGSLISETVRLEAIGDVPPGQEFAACGG